MAKLAFLNTKIGTSGLQKNHLKLQVVYKLYHGNNLKPFCYNEVKLALDSLYTLLDFDLSEAKLMQVDLAANLVMQSQVHNYFDLLVCPDGYKPMSVKNETYYFKKNDKAKRTCILR